MAGQPAAPYLLVTAQQRVGSVSSHACSSDHFCFHYTQSHPALTLETSFLMRGSVRTNHGGFKKDKCLRSTPEPLGAQTCAGV